MHLNGTILSKKTYAPIHVGFHGFLYIGCDDAMRIS